MVVPLLGVDLEWLDAIAATRRRLRLGPGDKKALADRVRARSAELRRQVGGS